MGRDRDPFERALEALRHRIAEGGLPQGAPLAVNALAVDLGVSPTPVREALARLAGEGLVVRTPSSGYATVTRDRRELAELYGLAGLLAEASLAVLVIASDAPAPSFAEALATGGTEVSRQAFERVRNQLAPFRNAEHSLLGDADLVALDVALAERQPARAIAKQARRYYRRRARKAAEILRHALGID